MPYYPVENDDPQKSLADLIAELVVCQIRIKDCEEYAHAVKHHNFSAERLPEVNEKLSELRPRLAQLKELINQKIQSQS